MSVGGGPDLRPSGRSRAGDGHRWAQIHSRRSQILDGKFQRGTPFFRQKRRSPARAKRERGYPVATDFPLVPTTPSIPPELPATGSMVKRLPTSVTTPDSVVVVRTARVEYVSVRCCVESVPPRRGGVGAVSVVVECSALRGV
eukprot:gene10517-biopygen15342